jgi:hypothetical protein
LRFRKKVKVSVQMFSGIFPGHEWPGCQGAKPLRGGGKYPITFAGLLNGVRCVSGVEFEFFRQRYPGNKLHDHAIEFHVSRLMCVMNWAAKEPIWPK